MQELDFEKTRLAPQSFKWYPYGTLNSFYLLDKLLTGEHRFLLDLIGSRPTLDIGCADGDLAFFMESLGCQTQVIDYAPTNYNGLHGVKLLKTARSSSVEIHEIDLDTQFTLPRQNFGLVFFLGILYHLKNPYYALEALAKSAAYSLISTRIAKFNAPETKFAFSLAKLRSDKRINLSQIPVAYLLDEREANNDATNYWVFSEAGLRRIFKRTGWEICDYMTVGDTVNSDPASVKGDQRAFCLVKSHLYGR